MCLSMCIFPAKSRVKGEKKKNKGRNKDDSKLTTACRPHIELSRYGFVEGKEPHPFTVSTGENPLLKGFLAIFWHQYQVGFFFFFRAAWYNGTLCDAVNIVPKLILYNRVREVHWAVSHKDPPAQPKASH